MYHRAMNHCAGQKERLSVWVGLGVGLGMRWELRWGGRRKPREFAKRITSNSLLCLVHNWDSEQHKPRSSLILFKGSHCKTSAFLNLIHYRLLYLMKLQQFNKWYNCRKYCFNIIMGSSLEHAIAFHNIIMTYAVIKFLIEGMQWMRLTC